MLICSLITIRCPPKGRSMMCIAPDGRSQIVGCGLSFSWSFLVFRLSDDEGRLWLFVRLESIGNLVRSKSPFKTWHISKIPREDYQQL